MARYIICPRCELNFIDADEQEYCDVCQKELLGEKTFSDDFEDAETVEEMEICPVCGEARMRLGETMCDECRKKTAYEDEVEEDDADKEDDDSWRSYLDDDDADDLGIDLSEEFGDEDDEVEEDEEETSSDEDEFEYVSADDYYDY
ncbi:MAG: hypothetical protein IJX98_06930, partial [Clostridia bacterium]|nr:hypothetical protein [Clostridia bacterium]